MKTKAAFGHFPDRLLLGPALNRDAVDGAPVVSLGATTGYCL